MPGSWLPAMSYRGSVDYKLEIDTVALDVTSSTILIESVRITQLPREGTGAPNFQTGNQGL